MTDEPNGAPPPEETPQDMAPQQAAPKTPPRPKGPVMLVPRSFIYIVAAIVIGSFALTLFVRNPYTQAVSEGSDYYERGVDNSMLLWVAIFIGIPASFYAYKRWILPLFERK